MYYVDTWTDSRQETRYLEAKRRKDLLLKEIGDLSFELKGYKDYASRRGIEIEI